MPHAGPEIGRAGGRVVEAFAPGRVNLIGDHTDYTGGLVLPMAVDLGTTVRLVEDPRVRVLTVTSDAAPGRVEIPIAAAGEVPGGAGGKGWRRLVTAVGALVPPPAGGSAHVATTLPVGAGLSSSSSFAVALAAAFGLDLPAPHVPPDLLDQRPVAAAAEVCRRAEETATGVPGGIMDQLTVLAGVPGHALLIDCAALTWRAVALPAGAQVIVAHSGERRRLAASAYAARRAECEAVERFVGPLRDLAGAGDLARIADLVLRRRARHVVSENARVAAMAEALAAGDLAGAGRLMSESHRSLADDFEVSTPGLDSVVEALERIPGVLGARLTGAGFGGCAVALAERGAFARAGRRAGAAGSLPSQCWLLDAARGARLSISGG